MGEIMMRLSPPYYNTLIQSNTLSVTYGGGEANVAVSLANFGHQTKFITALPSNNLGDGACNYLRGYGVDLSAVKRSGDNLGIYFLETGFGGRASQVTYKRSHAEVTKIKPEDFDFKAIFSDADWFHISGITLALSDDACNTAIYAMKIANEMGVKVSFDFNYRSKLWSIEESRVAYVKALPYVDVCMMSVWDIETILELKPTKDYDDEIEQHVDLYRQVNDIYNIEYIAGTKRQVFSATHNSLRAYIIGKDEIYRTDSIEFNIVDRIGGGDAFTSGVIHRLVSGAPIKDALDFGLANSILKHTILGDACILDEKTVDLFVQSKGNINVAR